MLKFSRRKALMFGAGAVVTSALPLRYAKAAEFNFKLGTNVPESHPLNVYAKKAADEI